MKKLHNVKNIWQQSQKITQEFSQQYILLNREDKQLTLKEKTVLLLCKQAEARVEHLTSLQPEEKEGMIAVIETEKIKAKLHFTPEKIIVKDDYIKGKLKLLNSPQLESNSIVYRYLIAGWQTFLGNKIPHQVLPKDIKVEQNKIYYSLPKDKIELLKPFWAVFQDDSALLTTLREKELTITSSVAFNRDNFKVQDLL
ncbi:hypothetical protein Sta7437_4883 (plasmid) [Stanieria cyanosphaera PCC 7437]|uniref:Uncharacterized protein n=1 Tax=Stanieria cyanosphaera (strain ATCC 29371 / PCC 7437) TaxID=111780 RepID=K9Y1M6_STAC7|nr:hypothetical protein [Stanieria cyanosphaera]AFZ38311.1 hypothetical protein Sta7437_4883 [Stanieria cyanosphaera PCC 7437]